MRSSILARAVLLAGAFGAFSAHGATFTVVNNSSAGAGSLAQAVTDANASPGLDAIVFNIAPGGAQSIIVTAIMPLNDPVSIDATTQPGFSGTPLIELNGNSVTAL